MKKFLVLIILAFILSGCATYKFQKPTTSGAGGYLAFYDGKPISEYTVGKEKSLPDLALAKERFKRRRSTVEYYYKKTGQIESRLKEYFWSTPVMIVDFLGGVFRWPFMAVADYRYNRNPQYKAKVDRLDEQKEELEKARINALKEKLAVYISEDLKKESPGQEVVTTVPMVTRPETVSEPLKQIPALPAVQDIAPEKEISVTQEVISSPTAVEPISTPVVETLAVPMVKPPEEVKPVVAPPIIKKVFVPPVAIIVTNPVKGSSPLKVNFSGQKSYSNSGKIIAYDWNFGDGDISTKKTPENTFWSTTFGSRNFTVILTVRDDAGNTSSVNTVIEVITQ